MASLINNLAEEYNSTKSYIVGDVVTYDNKLYMCVLKIPAVFLIYHLGKKNILPI